MKTTLKIILILLMLSITIQCSKDDPNPEPIAQPAPDPEPTPEPENNPPTSALLVSPEANAINIAMKPTFNWEAVTDADGDSITYELYADNSSNPSTLITTTSATSFTPAERLGTKENFNWKIIAKDGNGGESESDISSFETRDIFFSSATQNADFPGRRSFASTVFNGKVWISGGFQDSTLDLYRTNDVWNSEDGVNWTRVTTNAEWRRRLGHTMTAFKDKLWVIAGFGTEGRIADVWNSEDGITWNLVTDSPGFDAMHNHSVTVYQDKLWITHDAKVWFSEDGAVWTIASEGEIGNFRTRHTSVAFDNKIWVIGGSEQASSNVMSSSDGITWDLVNAEPPFRSSDIRREEHTSVVFDNKIWVISGRGTPGDNDVWYSNDGIDWTLATEEAPFSRRSSLEAEILNEKIWIFGGEERDGNANKNDVWFID